MSSENILARVRALAESDGMIARCDVHGYGSDAQIANKCDWCAAFGVDQDWREALLQIFGAEAETPQITP